MRPATSSHLLLNSDRTLNRSPSTSQTHNRMPRSLSCSDEVAMSGYITPSPTTEQTVRANHPPLRSIKISSRLLKQLPTDIYSCFT
ncbi:MAG TPA: hypothetical protein VK203_13615 [Nostocaceae cyanobacterium]|nr:hypothetical protein [Nostocaceae cyanobacterium]